jgi:hypothetical protein
MMRERITRSSDVLKERRKKTFVKYLWVLLGLVALFVLVAFLSYNKNLLIKDVEVSGNQILEEEDIKTETLKILKQNKVLFFLAGDNKFIYKENKLIEGLKLSFPRILNISIERVGNSLNINLSERERAFLWCGNEAPLFLERFEEGDCYFLDNSGFIFDKSPGFSSGVYFTFYSKTQDENPIGEHVLDFQFIKDINSLILVMSEKGLPAHSLVVKEEGQYELLLNIGTTLDDYPKLLFTKENTIEEIYNKFISIIDEEPFKTDFLEKSNKLEYIDFRFNNRVFYRFKE